MSKPSDKIFWRRSGSAHQRQKVLRAQHPNSKFHAPAYLNATEPQLEQLRRHRELLPIVNRIRLRQVSVSLGNDNTIMIFYPKFAGSPILLASKPLPIDPGWDDDQVLAAILERIVAEMGEEVRSRIEVRPSK